MSCSVQVAVRVRPFNARERKLNAFCCISMNGRQTVITNLSKKNDEKKFTFDYSYWSHDGYHEEPSGYLSPAPGSPYADQTRVFSDVGQGVIDSAWEGYHACLFAYGQTGSGKSYSMVGYGENKGIIPIACEEIFRRIGQNKDPTKSFEVSCSMLEVYNEHVHDLLIKPSTRPQGGLEIRESKVLGIFVEGLSRRAVNSYAGIQKIVDEGTSNRSIGATLMNATSSRAHTVVSIELQQITTLDGKQGRRTSVIHLVDLAGSEKNDQTQASGDRLKEGCAINKSLSALGNVISALADKAAGKDKGRVIPYRDSKLTRLLQNALGGSCRTIMLCALSPASNNYDETLSTLRYADRAKQVKNFAVVNEDPTLRLIRELREENEKLKALLEGKNAADRGLSEAERKALEEEHQKEIRAMENALHDMEKSFQQKLEESQKQAAAQTAQGTVDPSSVPHLTVLNEDVLLSGQLNFALPSAPGHLWIGKKKGDWTPDVSLSGLGVFPKHCRCALDASKRAVYLEVVEGINYTFVNGEKITQKKPVSLRSGDRLVLGQAYAFLVVFPAEQTQQKLLAEHTYDGVLEEVCVAQGEVKRVKPNEVELQEEKAKAEAYKRQAEAMQRAQKEFEEKMRRAAQKASADERQKVEEEFRKKHEALEREKKELQRKEMRRCAAETDRKVVEEKLVEVLPLIKEANLIAAELKKPYELTPSFDMTFTSTGERRSNVIVAVMFEGKPVYDWAPAVLENRLFLMRELLDAYTDAKDKDGFLKRLKKEDDPFWDPIEKEKCIGKAVLFLESLTAQLETESNAHIFNKEGVDVGQLKVAVFPVSRDGHELEDDDIKESPAELLGTSMYYEVRILSASGLPAEFANNTFVRFKPYLSSGYIETSRVNGANTHPVFNFKKILEQTVTPAFMEYLENEVLIFEVYGEDSRATK
ncbi:putative kinesin motor domain cointaining protein [Neospora caninum Liverpool]|uniref:Kinesin-like protein n=1 Tax=Neospora caninum (strain Liverpool) TaxID=572307 RepID=F0V8H9_NEOCL|nr:putative kinesin motor domain cointaining protein [Neospora caninum Liverpool]CBZ50020.1 putative kinesin motor domain cointaining protein [Neospora caninum Liverpool]CEL64610.1 TPA: kinesin motor domain cointaining protein,putative [Neospora caninum Liverpool]|eukprot:XP_003880055.1 putative kinesin motor domain cointaining protein [Neospora caninum Liverpool]